MAARNGHRDIADNDELRARVVEAKYNYEGRPSNRSLRDLSEQFGLRPPAINAILERAWEKGEIVIHRRGQKEQLDVGRLQQAMLARYGRFGLRNVWLVPGDLEILGDLDLARRRALRTEIMEEMAAMAAKLLDERVAAAAACQREALAAGERPDVFTIGVAWGRMLHLFAQHLLCTARPCHLSDLLVVPIVAPTAAFRQDPVEANLVAMDIARAYGGWSGQLLCPAFVNAEQAEFLRRLPDVRRMLNTARNAHILFTSLGAIPPDPHASEIRVSNDPSTNQRILDEASKTAAIGDICGTLFGPDGKDIPMSIETMGLKPEDLRAIASDKEGDVVGVVGGDKDRCEPLRVALEAGFFSQLISDTVTAKVLVDEVQVDVPPRTKGG